MKRSVKQALDYAFKKGFQIHPQVVEILQEVEVEDVDKIIKDIVHEKSIDKNYHINGHDLISYLGLEVDGTIEDKHEILFDCTARITMPQGVDGYASLFRSRFDKMRGLMAQRPESGKVKSISSLGNGKDEKASYVCGLVNNKYVRDDTFRLTLEDPTGVVEGFVVEDARKVFEGLFLDQFVMAKVDGRDEARFVEIMLPDIPLHRVNHSSTEAFAVLLSDLHVGSKYFLEDAFREFLDWLVSPDPYARKVRFVVIAGDVIDGVGIFPNQDKELLQHTASDQLGKVLELLSSIPDYIKIFISPGNHDPGRRALPQPAIPYERCPGMWDKKNIYMLGNPAMISLNGVRVMVFHGQSIDDIVKEVAGMEYSHPVDIMKGMLRARHLSPIFGSQTPIAPEGEDLLVINEVPDVLHSGHVHITEVSAYKGIKIINSGAWQSQTPFQVSVGQVPTPGIAVLLNLKTHQIMLRNFLE